MSEIRPKLSSLVAGQLPEFIREDHQTFVAFLEAYYEYLDTVLTTDYKNVRDIDYTLDSFIKYFKHELLVNMPSVQVDERFLIRHIKELYSSKGTPASFKLLFRILFNKEVVVDYPYSSVLIPSDGKWVQDNSIFVKISVGTPDYIVGRTVDMISSSGTTFKVLIKSYQPAKVKIGGITQNSTDTFEFYFTKAYFDVIGVGSILKDGNDFIGSVISTTVNVSVYQAGTGFKPGQVFEIVSTGGFGSLLKIKSVDINNGIKSAEFVTFGIGYTTNFTAYISPTQLSTSSLVNFSVVGTNVTLTDSTQSFLETGSISRPTYNSDILPAIDPTYAGEVVQEFYDANVSGSAVLDQSTLGIIVVNIGAVAKHIGYFKNNDGFLDDAVYIQDSKYYQPFSYVLKIDEKLDNYKSFVKSIVHPTGSAMFGEYSITNVIDTGTSLESLLKILTVIVSDEVTVSDTASIAFSKLIPTISGYTTSSNNSLGVKMSVTLTGRSVTTAINNGVVMGTAMGLTGRSVTTGFGGTAYGVGLGTGGVTGKTLTTSSSNLVGVISTSGISPSLNTTILEYITASDSGFIMLNPYSADLYVDTTYIAGAQSF